MTTSLSHKLEDNNMLYLSHLYPGVYTPMFPPQGDQVKTRRRRKKNKGGDQGVELGGITGMKKRKLSEQQVNSLEMSFGNEHKLEGDKKDKLASELGLDPRQVAVWFQNRRARWKNKKLEEEYSKLKSAHENTVLDKCHLESEVLKLKDQLSDANNEIQRLSERLDGFSLANSPSSTMEANYPPYMGDFEVYENIWNIEPDMNNYAENGYNYTSHGGIEWTDLNYM